jgi:hypothetical protein
MQPVSAQAKLGTGGDVVEADLVDDVEGRGVVKTSRYIVEETGKIRRRRKCSH